MRMPNKRSDLYLRLLAREPTPLLILTNNQLRVVFGNLTVSEPIAVHLPVPHGNRILLKLEHLAETSPTGSFYDRVYPWLFLRAEAEGFIHPDRTLIIEASVGNAGAAFAYVALELGYRRPIVLLPEDIYGARKQQILELGADVRYSPPRIGPIGYIHMLERMLADDWRIHGRPRKDGKSLYAISKIRKVPNLPYALFVHEVMLQLKTLSKALDADSEWAPCVDAFVFGVGSGGTVSGVGRAVKRLNPNAKVLVCEHLERPFVDRYKKRSVPSSIPYWPEPDWPATTIHGVPLRKLSLNLNVIDDQILIDRSLRDKGWHLCNSVLGLGAGRPTGLALQAALTLGRQVDYSTILTLVFDHFWKYERRARSAPAPALADLMTAWDRCFACRNR